MIRRNRKASPEELAELLKVAKECADIPEQIMIPSEYTYIALEKEIEIEDDFYGTCFFCGCEGHCTLNFMTDDKQSKECPGTGKYKMTLTKIDEEIKKEESENE